MKIIMAQQASFTAQAQLCCNNLTRRSLRRRLRPSRQQNARVVCQGHSDSKGRDRPWIVAQGQPVMAPRTQELGGDPFNLLLKQRIVFLGGEVNDFIADAIVSQLLLLDAQDPSKDIKLFINSPGWKVMSTKLLHIRLELQVASKRFPWIYFNTSVDHIPEGFVSHNIAVLCSQEDQ